MAHHHNTDDMQRDGWTVLPRPVAVERDAGRILYVDGVKWEGAACMGLGAERQPDGTVCEWTGDLGAIPQLDRLVTTCREIVGRGRA